MKREFVRIVMTALSGAITGFGIILIMEWLVDYLL